MKHMNLHRITLAGILLLSLLLLAGCASTVSTDAATATTSNAVTPTATPQAVTLKVFDAAELAKYNGQNGASAYIAVEGKVYDVTDVPQWKGGTHFSRFQAGQDLTTEIETLSPHGVSKLNDVPIVGLYQP
jgi:predicted heme/steroid binding protein